MSDRYLGCTVSIRCTDELGTYQGQIVALSNTYVTLAKPFCNGVPHSGQQGSKHVTIKAKDIIDINIISEADTSNAEPETQTHSRVLVKKPIAKRAGRSVSECSPHQNVQTAVQSSSKKNIESQMQDVALNGKVNTNQTRNSRKKLNDKDEQAFGNSIDNSLQQDFDFEKNLALFNKQAVWQEINSRKPDVVRQSENSRTNNKYRHDENVIKSEPTIFRQIQVPTADSKEYVTDDGLVIPSITLELQRQLIGSADRFGISWERRVELLGRAGTEIALQLLGGAHRLNPNNAHQWPTIVALCGPHRSGAAGINCARQLSSHGVKTIVYVESSEDVSLIQELSLYKLTGNRVEREPHKLPAVADLIILALFEEKSPRVVSPVSHWANNNRASILAIEPPSTGTPGIKSKYSLLSGLPLSHSTDNGRLYLCNLALPDKVFLDVGINYKSPFGPKFVIPLHLNSS